MRSLEEIRTEMQDAATYYKLSKDAGLEVPAARWEATYDTLAWVLEESWKNTGEFEKKERKVVRQTYLTHNDTRETETTLWSDNSASYKHRTRTNMATSDWSEWRDGKGEMTDGDD